MKRKEIRSPPENLKQLIQEMNRILKEREENTKEEEEKKLKEKQTEYEKLFKQLKKMPYNPKDFE